MKYKTKSCPYCNHTYTILDSAYFQYGSPIRTCKRCGKIFIDKDYHEIAVEGITWATRQHLKNKVSNSSIAGLIISLFIFLGGILNNASEYASILLWGGGLLGALSIWCIIDDIKKYHSFVEDIEKEKAASRARLSVPAYASALKELGYDVPMKYLDNTASKNQNQEVNEDAKYSI